MKALRPWILALITVWWSALVPPVAGGALVRPAADALPLRGEALAHYLVGTWYRTSGSDTEVSDTEHRFNGDGSFSVVMTLYRRTSATARNWQSMQSTALGTWHIDGDVCVEMVHARSMPLMDLPTTERTRISATEADRHLAEDLASGRRVVQHRQAATTDEHVRAVRAPWVGMAPQAAWTAFHEGEAGIDHYQATTVRRRGAIAGVWVRSDLSAAALERAHALIADAATDKPVVIMEHTFVHLLIDCQRNLSRPRHLRVFEHGRLAAESRYEGEDPLLWTRIKPVDTMELELKRLICGG